MNHGVFSLNVRPSSSGETYTVLQQEADVISYNFSYAQKTNLLVLEKCDMVKIPLLVDNFDGLPETFQRRILNIVSEISGVDALKDPSTLQHQFLQ